MTMTSTINYYGQLFDGAAITPAITRAAEDTRQFGLAMVTAKTPRRTGRLASNWQVQLEAHGLRYQNPTPYGIFVEMGTRHLAGRHMLESSLGAIEAHFKKALAREVGLRLGKRIVADITSGTDLSYQSLTDGTRQTSSGFRKLK